MSLAITLLLFLLSSIEEANTYKIKAQETFFSYLTNSNITYEIIPSINNTWGYDIFIDNKKIIHQPSIPGLPGNEGFKTKEDAQIVAELVVNKIKKGEMPPSISIDELKTLRIILKTCNKEYLY